MLPDEGTVPDGPQLPATRTPDPDNAAPKAAFGEVMGDAEAFSDASSCLVNNEGNSVVLSKEKVKVYSAARSGSDEPQPPPRI